MADLGVDFRGAEIDKNKQKMVKPIILLYRKKTSHRERGNFLHSSHPSAANRGIIHIILQGVYIILPNTFP